MKKIFYSFIAVAAMALVSCGGQTKADESCCDSTCCDSAVVAEVDPSAAVEALAAAFETADAEVIQGALATCEGMIAQLTADGNETAEAYAASVKECIQANIEKVEAVSADNEAIQESVKKILNVEE